MNDENLNILGLIRFNSIYTIKCRAYESTLQQASQSGDWSQRSETRCQEQIFNFNQFRFWQKKKGSFGSLRKYSFPISDKIT